MDFKIASGFPEMENIYAVPNGAHLARGARSYISLKLQGLRPGVLDINIDIPAGEHHGARLELKRLGCEASPEQLDRIALNRSLGYLSTVADSWERAIDLTVEYLKLKWPDFKK